ncbi:MAG: peptide/nickel transport system permease protein [Thermomicrobiales bacterium]|jgi:peptide/nickel transport system permease protein|nr:peptide/nickel transport system permease protein [Thermomicrobiales bacterium]
MRKYLIQRFIHSVTILFGISVLVFVLVELAPGDVVDAMISPEDFVTPEVKAQLRTELGLDEPAPVRYVRWLGRTVQGDFGYSLASRKPISEMILARMPTTLELVGFALVLSVVLGVGTGVIAAVKQYSWADYLATFSAFAWLSIPEFFLGMLMIYLFAVRLNWFPAFGTSTAGAENHLLDRLDHLILPGITLGLGLTAALTRYTRSSLLEVLNSDYMTTARAKGLQERSVIVRHGLRNALIPIITVVAFRMPYLISGAVIIETVFQWPGLGFLTLNAATQKDYPLIMALALAVSVIVIASSFVADVAYSFIDPRIRYGD